MRIRTLLTILLMGFVTLSGLAQNNVKLTEYEIDKIEAMVYDFYDCSNVIAEDGPTSGHCAQRLKTCYFGRLCSINNDFYRDTTEINVSSGYFSHFAEYVRALRKTGVQMEVLSIAPFNGEWIKIKKIKLSESDPDTYLVSVVVIKRIIFNDSLEKKCVNQIINICLPDYTITGIHAADISYHVN